MRHGSTAQVLYASFHIHQHPLAPVEHQMSQQSLEQSVAFAGAAAPGIGQRPHDQQALFALCCFYRASQWQGRRKDFWQVAHVRVKIHHAALSGGANTLFNKCSAPTMASPFLRWPKMRQMASYSSQNTTKKASATMMAVAGAQSIFDLSMR